MWVIENMVEIIYLTKLYIQGQFLAPIIIDVIIIIFYKVTRNAKLAFNLVITKIFDLFYSRILAFLFIIIYYGISKY